MKYLNYVPPTPVLDKNGSINYDLSLSIILIFTKFVFMVYLHNSCRSLFEMVYTLSLCSMWQPKIQLDLTYILESSCMEPIFILLPPVNHFHRLKSTLMKRNKSVWKYAKLLKTSLLKVNKNLSNENRISLCKCYF